MATNLFDLSGRIALVTGASRGIGAAIAKLLAEQGAQVIVSSRKLDGCRAVVDKISAAGGSAEALACHIGDMGAIEKIFATIREWWTVMPSACACRTSSGDAHMFSSPSTQKR